jgi:hypothetical protein
LDSTSGSKKLITHISPPAVSPRQRRLPNGRLASSIRLFDQGLFDPQDMFSEFGKTRTSGAISAIRDFPETISLSKRTPLRHVATSAIRNPLNGSCVDGVWCEFIENNNRGI